MSYIDRKYISLLSPRIPLFKWKSPNLANGRCPICGDSKHHPNKRRLYIYENTGKWWVKCHNCEYSTIFSKFLRQLDENLYSEYTLELMEDRQHFTSNDDASFQKDHDLHFDQPKSFEALIKLKRISSLPMEHPAWKYVKSRQIPNPYHAKFRWTDNFMGWTNSIMPGKFKQEAVDNHDEGRIIIPFFNKNNHFFAYTGRSLNPEAEVRYITIVLNGKEPLLWGAEDINYKLSDINVFEGPLDATFIDNSIALAGGNISGLTKIADRGKFRIAYDNEPRKKETREKILRAIDNGFRVVIWSEHIREKDINQMVLAGYHPNHIRYTMEKNTFAGLEAKMRLDQWSKA